MSDPDWLSIADEARQYLTSDDRVRFLACVAAALTLTARDCYLAGGGLAEHAGTWLRCHNEVQHQLTNHLTCLVMEGKSPYRDEDFLEVLVTTGRNRGCGNAVRGAIKIAIERMAWKPRGTNGNSSPPAVESADGVTQ